jgi:hypothetical protein
MLPEYDSMMGCMRLWFPNSMFIIQLQVIIMKAAGNQHVMITDSLRIGPRSTFGATNLCGWY